MLPVLAFNFLRGKEKVHVPVVYPQHFIERVVAQNLQVGFNLFQVSELLGVVDGILIIGMVVVLVLIDDILVKVIVLLLLAVTIVPGGNRG